jgi:hypothetical protein
MDHMAMYRQFSIMPTSMALVKYMNEIIPGAKRNETHMRNYKTANPQHTEKIKQHHYRYNTCSNDQYGRLLPVE